MLKIAAFGIIGAGLKFIDDAFDEGTFDRKIAIAIAPVLIIMWVILSIFDNISSTILSSILISVLLSGKINNEVFKFCTFVLIPFAVAGISWMFLFLAMLGILD